MKTIICLNNCILSKDEKLLSIKFYGTSKGSSKVRPYHKYQIYEIITTNPFRYKNRHFITPSHSNTFILYKNRYYRTVTDFNKLAIILHNEEINNLIDTL